MEKIDFRTTIYSGIDSLDHLRSFENKKIWVICDQFLVTNGSIKEILKYIEKKNKVTVFKDVVPDTPVSVVAKGVAFIKDLQPDIIIAYGGGSSIDTAKGILYFARIADFLNEITFIAIPTTSGTGSEVTSTVVISDQKTKHPITDETILPDEVILCPTLTVSVPPAVTANTGMDVFTHAIEAYVAKKATAYSDALAQKACELVLESLATCYHNGTDLEARSKMQQASNLAGSAFNLAGLGMNHSIAHQIGAKFHIPHGLANALLMTRIITKNSSRSEIMARYATLSRKLGLATANECDQVAVDHLNNKIHELQQEMNMPVRLRDCKVEYDAFESKLEEMTKDALQDDCRLTAPYIYNYDEIVIILASLY
ncbi:alcohol dehydrogenase [Lachnospiraceae bacterium KM106-2]|nr:alcohol dehydrogenase [Lachnospiraceae bacterium KM106-2]